MPKTAKKRSAACSKVTRLQAQTRAIRLVNGVMLCLFALSVGFVAVATALPQKRKLAEIEQKLERVLEREEAVIAAKQDAEAGLRALSEDPEYLEIHARDRLNLHRPGEKIYRIERER